MLRSLLLVLSDWSAAAAAAAPVSRDAPKSLGPGRKAITLMANLYETAGSSKRRASPNRNIDTCTATVHT